MCALAAARQGRQVTLIERNGFLGGCATAGLVVPFMSFHAMNDQVVKGYADELISEIAKLSGTIGHIHDAINGTGTVTPIDTEVYKYVAQEMLLKAGVNILFHTELIDAIRNENSIKEVIVHTLSGNYIIEAKRFVDASGNADLIWLSEEETHTGRDADGKVQPMSMIFKIDGVDRNKVIEFVDKHPQDFVVDEKLESMGNVDRIAIAGFFTAVSEAQKNGDLKMFRDRVLAFELNRYGEMAVNMSRIVNRVATEGFDWSEAEIEGRQQIFEIIGFLKKYVAGFENARLVESASQVGIRESRRLSGQYTLTQEDIVSGKKFDDGVAIGCWPIDIHDPEGKKLVVVKMEPGTRYDIPYRCLVPKVVENLLAAGRIISTTHEAFASSRVTPTCFAIGQAAGIAVAISIEDNCALKDVNVETLRSRLCKTGQCI